MRTLVARKTKMHEAGLSAVTVPWLATTGYALLLRHGPAILEREPASDAEAAAQVEEFLRIIRRAKPAPPSELLTLLERLEAEGRAQLASATANAQARSLREPAAGRIGCDGDPASVFEPRVHFVDWSNAVQGYSAAVLFLVLGLGALAAAIGLPLTARSEDMAASLVLAGIALLSAPLFLAVAWGSMRWASNGSLTLTRQSIAYEDPLGRVDVPWADIISIEREPDRGLSYSAGASYFLRLRSPIRRLTAPGRWLPARYNVVRRIPLTPFDPEGPLDDDLPLYAPHLFPPQHW